MGNLREEILDACFGPAETVFAGGDLANNKLDAEKIDLESELGLRVIAGLVRCTSLYKPDFVVDIPNGATPFAEVVASELDIDCVKLKKIDETGDIKFSSVKEQRHCYRLKRGVLIEDVPNRLTSINKTLAITAVRTRAVAAVGIWDRGISDRSYRKKLPIPLHALITEHIPAQLPPDSEYWKYAK